MKIRSAEQYRKVLERYNALVSAEETTETSAELAELESAMHAYGLPSDQPATSPGRPTPDPYDLDAKDKGKLSARQAPMRKPAASRNARS
jgi:hypothetical protein